MSLQRTVTPWLGVAFVDDMQHMDADMAAERAPSGTLLHLHSTPEPGGAARRTSLAAAVAGIDGCRTDIGGDHDHDRDHCASL